MAYMVEMQGLPYVVKREESDNGEIYVLKLGSHSGEAATHLEVLKDAQVCADCHLYTLLFNLHNARSFWALASPPFRQNYK